MNSQVKGTSASSCLLLVLSVFPSCYALSSRLLKPSGDSEKKNDKLPEKTHKLQFTVTIFVTEVLRIVLHT